MEKDIMNQIASNAPFAALFVWLLWDTRKEARESRKESREREDVLHGLIDKLADKFNVVEDIKEDVDIIKNHIFNDEGNN